MRFVTVFILILLCSFQQGSAPKKWVVMGGCALKVDGSTNINKFSCEIVNYSNPDTILVNLNSTPIQLNGQVRLDVANFDCHNGIMTADLRKTLKAKEFPYFTIRFKSINKYPDQSSLREITKGIVVIDLAGVSKVFDIDYKVVNAEPNFINLVGYRKLNFTDFNLTPPRKLGGMIRTDNELNVAFNLRVHVIY